MIVQHPSSRVTFDPPRAVCCAFGAEHGACPEHAREDDYPETQASIMAAYLANCDQRDALHIDPLPVPSRVTMALRGQMPPDTCTACGELIALHYDTSGCILIGCEGVPARKRVGGLVSRPLAVPEQYSNPYPEAAEALDAALRAACGVSVTLFYEALTASERLNLSRRLAEIAGRAMRGEK